MLPTLIATAAIVSTLLILAFWVPLSKAFDFDTTESELATPDTVMKVSASELQDRFQGEYIQEMLAKAKPEVLQSNLEKELVH